MAKVRNTYVCSFILDRHRSKAVGDVGGVGGLFSEVDSRASVGKSENAIEKDEEET